MTERTLILLKPDALQRKLRGEILRRIEAKGYDIIALDQRVADADTLARHYAEHEGKPFHAPLVDYMGSGPLVALIAEGEGVIEGFRSLAGATDPTTATPGSIRGDLARADDSPVIQNLVHGSDSPESAAQEISIWFPHLA